jgi:hypothetical protein
MRRWAEGAAVMIMATTAVLSLAGCNDSGPTYTSCADVSAANAAPIHKGDPGYSGDLDRDGDGVACEKP